MSQSVLPGCLCSLTDQPPFNLPASARIRPAITKLHHSFRFPQRPICDVRDSQTKDRSLD